MDNFEDKAAGGKDQVFTLADLSHQAEIRIDHWGIPHISAENEDDLFFAQGFNAARDRLWQIDLWRKRGLGLLAADFGPGFLAQDYASRHFLYRGDMDAEWQAYGPKTKAICIAFVKGINAYVDQVLRDPEQLLPVEFQTLGTKPAFWSAEDVVRIRTHALSRNGISEILRTNVIALSDPQTDLLRINIQPHAEPALHPAIEAGDIPLSAVDILKLASASVTFDPDRLASSLEDAWRWTRVNDLGEFLPPQEKEGSNNWAVHGSRTASGRPILASDPHRIHTMPSTRYLVHLTTGGLDVIGTGEPVAPGLCIGHNGQLAFGLTIFGADQEDVFVYETSGEDGKAYRYGDAWEDFEVIEESFAVKGCPDQMHQISFTRHGPVIHKDAKRGRALALRTVWTDPGSAPYLGSLAYMECTTTAEFGAALTHWGTPSVNQVCADTNGDIGWFTAGFTPVRENWNGLLPVPGTGEFEWSGYVPANELPHAVNPDEGFIATANEMNIPQDCGLDTPIGFEWADASRSQRLKSVLAQDAQHDLKASMAMQLDTYSEPAAALCTLLNQARERLGQDAELPQAVASALDLLKGWDFRLDIKSREATLFEIWWMKHLRAALFSRFASDPRVIKWLPPGDTGYLLGLLGHPEPRWSISERDETLLSSLEPAFAECVERMGPDPKEWQWGKLHQVLFEHPLHRQMPDALDAMNVGPFAQGGSRATPSFGGYRLSDFRVTAGATVRLVIDVGDWDKSVCVNTPGQSGDPDSPHYADLANLWAQGEYVPLLYSRQSIESHTDRVIRLTPSS